jgi:hypothetical protein
MTKENETSDETRIEITIDGKTYYIPCQAKTLAAPRTTPGHGMPPRYIPQNRDEMLVVYGDPNVTYESGGKVVPDHKWEKDNMILVSKGLIAGYDKRLYMHKLVVERFCGAMKAVYNLGYRFKSIGCFNPRHQRYDRNLPLSDHTWGIAFDIDPPKNKPFYRDASSPRPFDYNWHRVSSMTEDVVDIFKYYGFEWGGDWGKKLGGFVDPMHFSLRGRR